MINITVDDKACVGCRFCVDVCPTGVLAYDEQKELPEPAKAKECFGCLSCTEICPAGALSHEGTVLSECFYHDEYAVRIARKMLCHNPVRYKVIDELKGYEAAMGDISVRLLSVGAVLKDVVGAGLPSVGLMAGRSLATQLPRYQPPSNFAEACALARQEFLPAWDITFSPVSEESLRITVNQCFIRTLCANEKKPLGGELCTLFFHYLAGYLGKMGKTQVKLEKAERGQQCVYDVKIQR